MLTKVFPFSLQLNNSKLNTPKRLPIKTDVTIWCTFFKNCFSVFFLSNIPRKRTANHNKHISFLWQRSSPRDCNFLFYFVCFIQFFFLQNVYRKGLRHKMASPGIIDSVFSVIKSFLSGRSMKVVSCTQSSETHQINFGVSWGFLRGSTLFSLYIYDLPKNYSQIH